METLGVLMTWLHLAGAMTILGTMIYARLIAVPAMAELAAEERKRLLAALVARARGIWFAAIGVMLLSGLYTLMTHIASKPPRYHMVIGIKILLALHVFTVAFLLSAPPGLNPARDARRPRLLAGAIVSGLVVLLLSAYLRRSF